MYRETSTPARARASAYAVYRLLIGKCAQSKCEITHLSLTIVPNKGGSGVASLTSLRQYA
jgi:hypothetical protein